MSQKGRVAPLDARTIADMENLLAQVQNVVSVKIVTDHFGHIQEIHAVAEPGTNPKTVVRDFEAVLFTRWNIRIDRRKISIALLKDPNPPPAQPPRLRIRYIGLKVSGMEAEARVELATPMQTGEGRACGLATQSNRLRLMSEATLSAVSRFLQEGYHLVLEDIRPKSVGDRQVIVACVTITSPKQPEEHLLGTCLLREDELDSAVRATLSALNRRLKKIAYLR